MSVYLISDTHLNHNAIKTHCDRPDDFTERINRNIHRIVKPTDILIHLGDVGIDKTKSFIQSVKDWPGTKWLIRGNHDQKGNEWWATEGGFHAACDAMIFRGCWLTHKPWHGDLPHGTHLNIHGHLHNVWDGFYPDDPEAEQDEFTVAAHMGRLVNPWQRLFAVEYTDYAPVAFDKFVSHPDRYQARGPNAETRKRIEERGSIMKSSCPCTDEGHNSC